MQENDIQTAPDTTPVSECAFSSRTMAVLERAGVVTLKDLLELRSTAYRRGKRGRGINFKSREEAEDKLLSLGLIELLPDDVTPIMPVEPDPFLWELDASERVNIYELAVPFARRVLEFYGQSRAYEILVLRHRLDGGPARTLESIGRQFGLTRERIRQIVRRSQERVLEVMLGSKHVRGWRIPESLTMEASALALELQALGDVFGEDVAERFVRKKYFVETTEPNQLRFMLSLFGYEPVAKKRAGIDMYPGDVWVLAGSSMQQLIQLVPRPAMRMLESRILPMNYSALKNYLSRQIAYQLDDRSLESLLAVCPKIEARGDGQYWTRFEHLSSLADKTFRVLSEHGGPLTEDAIATRINEAYERVGQRPDWNTNGENVRARLLVDGRFKSRGRRSPWALTQWEA